MTQTTKRFNKKAFEVDLHKADKKIDVQAKKVRAAYAKYKDEDLKLSRLVSEKGEIIKEWKARI